jgi:hypothetical protein
MCILPLHGLGFDEGVLLMLDMFWQFHVTCNASYHHASINTDPALRKIGRHMQHESFSMLLPVWSTEILLLILKWAT